MKTIYSVLFLIICLNSSSQTLVNTLWSTVTGLPQTIDWNASCLDGSGKLIVTGNTDSGTGDGINVLTSKHNTNGTIAWQVQYDKADSSDYGIAIVANSSYASRLLNTCWCTIR